MPALVLQRGELHSRCISSMTRAIAVFDALLLFFQFGRNLGF
jgi:hypothetical protein